MSDKLYFLTCRSLQREMAAAISAEGWKDVSAIVFPTACDPSTLSWAEVSSILPADCTQLIMFGQTCIKAIGEPPPAFPPTRVLQFKNCHQLVAGVELVTDVISSGGFLMTPAWLADWRGHLAEMGFEREQAGDFFHDFAKELVLLDTGTDPDARANLADFKDAVRLHARRIAVGIDYTRLLLARLVLEWRLEVQQEASGKQSPRAARPPTIVHSMTN